MYSGVHTAGYVYTIYKQLGICRQSVQFCSARPKHMCWCRYISPVTATVSQIFNNNILHISTFGHPIFCFKLFETIIITTFEVKSFLITGRACSLRSFVRFSVRLKLQKINPTSTEARLALDSCTVECNLLCVANHRENKNG